MRDLFDAFQRHRPQGHAASVAVEQALGRAWQQARGAWPEIDLPVEPFGQKLAEVCGADAQLDVVIAALHAADLYLATACAVGHRGALNALDQAHLTQIPAFLAAQRPTAQFCDDVKQAVRERLLVADADRAPRITTYRGDGPLGGWIRTVALRVAADLRRQAGSPSAEQDDTLAQQASAGDPELAYLRERYDGAFREALQAGMAQIPPREAAILRLHFLQGLPTSAIAGMYGTSRWTIRRSVNETLEVVRKFIRQALSQGLQLDAGDLESLLRLYTTDLDASVARYLRQQDPGIEPDKPAS